MKRPDLTHDEHAINDMLLLARENLWKAADCRINYPTFNFKRLYSIAYHQLAMATDSLLLLSKEE